MDDLKALIRDVPGFPEPGIIFKDVTPLLEDGEAFGRVIDTIVQSFTDAGVTHVAGIESRGFIFAAPVAKALGAGLVLIRKAGKLPRPTVAEPYALEYGTGTLEVHEDAVGAGDRVVVIDDVLATGGTLGAAIRLIQHLGAEVVGVQVLIELAFLDGRRHVDMPIETLVAYGAP
ncbi:MAG TPA: adenine phosphoribosyltransferase [Acidimicrobiia bacterium]|nr:adenine phosphoribosyltransferase [Acidimicrobiia bacterium]